MPSRGQTITITYTAWDTVNNVGKTGDSANHTLLWVKDGTSAAPTNSPAEVDATNAPGIYKLVLTGTECTCDSGTLCGKSSTSNVSIVSKDYTFEQLPTAVPAANGGLPTVDANNNVHGLQVGTGTGQINSSGGKVPATVAAADVSGNPSVNAAQIGGQAVALDTNNLLKVDVEDIHGTALSVAKIPATLATGDVTGNLNANVLQVNGTNQTARDLGANLDATISSTQTLISNLNNLSALANLFAPSTLVRPSSGSIVYPFTFIIKDTEGHLIDVDSNTVTLTAANTAGTDRSANLSAVTHAGTGEYTFTYTVASSHADEGLRFTASGTVQSATRKAWSNNEVADANTLSGLAAIQAQTDKLTFDGSNRVSAVAAVVSDKTGYTVTTVSDKTGYSLATAPPTLAQIQAGMPSDTSIQTDVQTALTNQGYTGLRAGYLDVLNGLLAAIWSYAARTLTAFGFSVTVGTNNDKSGYSLTSAPPTASTIATAVDTQLSGTHGSGGWGAGASVIYGEGGSIPYTLTVTEQDGTTPIPNVAVYVSSDSAGVYRSQIKLTDSTGRVQFQLDPSTVYFWMSRNDRTFNNPVVKVVS